MTLAQLKAHNPKAHSSLVKMWTELSRCSVSTARRDLQADIGFRYQLEEKKGELRFTDLHSGDIFKYDGQGWV